MGPMCVIRGGRQTKAKCLAAALVSRVRHRTPAAGSGEHLYPPTTSARAYRRPLGGGGGPEAPPYPLRRRAAPVERRQRSWEDRRQTHRVPMPPSNAVPGSNTHASTGAAASLSTSECRRLACTATPLGAVGACLRPAGSWAANRRRARVACWAPWPPPVRGGGRRSCVST